MSEQVTKKRKRSPFPPTFYVANVMEIFERLAWYGFFAVSSLYMTSPIAQGGLGFDSIQRGILQGIIPFLLYLFPVITGALADRYGYRNMFLVAFGIMTPAYFFLGQVHGFWPFFFVFLLVAVGAAVFKPVVVGTVGKTTDDTNRGLGFGVFYTIVNIGGFFGPIVAGYVRAISWDLVFVMSAIWIGINFIPTLFFYKEPTTESQSAEKRSLKKVLTDAQEVLGNGRFALAIAPVIVMFMLAGGEWVSWLWVLVGSIVWLVLNYFLNGRFALILMVPFIMVVYGLDNFVGNGGRVDAVENLPAVEQTADVAQPEKPGVIEELAATPGDSAAPVPIDQTPEYFNMLEALGLSGAMDGLVVEEAAVQEPMNGWLIVGIIGGAWAAIFLVAMFRKSASEGPLYADEVWHKQKPQIGNWPFVLYLLILTGFWASFNQIFITMPEYIRDFVDTTDMVKGAAIFGQGVVHFLASVNVEQLAGELGNLVKEHSVVGADANLRELFLEIVNYKVRVPEQEIVSTFQALSNVHIPDAKTLEVVAQEWAGRVDGADAAAIKMALKQLYTPEMMHLTQGVDLSASGVEVPAVRVVNDLLLPFAASGSTDPAVFLNSVREFSLIYDLAPQQVLAYTQDMVIAVPTAVEWAQNYRQVNPEYIINLDAGSIVIFQILVSSIIDRWKPFPVLVVGTIVAGIGIGIGGISHGIVLGGTFVAVSIVVFAFGEMIASPKSQEYVARIAPKQKTALFMGYYFVSVALGNLFGGILSGWGYQKIALEMNAPMLMWILFGCVGFLTAIALLFFNKGVVPMLEAQREANQTNGV